MDPGAFYRAHKDEVDECLKHVLESGSYILGQEVAAFEKEFAAALGVGHAVGVASGTDALVLALRALGVAHSDRVATVSHTAVATVAAIELAGAEPVFIDISPETFTLDPSELAATFERVTGIKAVVAVHLYGHPADVTSIRAIAKRYGAFLIEDCSQAHGAKLDNQAVGTLGDIATFSFYPTKNLGAFGDGGVVTTREPRLAETMLRLRQYGWVSRYVSETTGMNTRLDEIQAAFLRLRLKYLASSNSRRRQIAEVYDRSLVGCGLILPAPNGRAYDVYHQYVVRHSSRDELRLKLEQAGIGTNIHYPVPVHLQPAYMGRLLTGPKGLAHTEEAAKSVLSLPMFPELDDASVEQTVLNIRRVLGA